LSAEASHILTGVRPDSRSQGVHEGHGHNDRDPRASIEAGDALTVPVAGQSGRGITACIRRQPVRIVEGRKEGGYRDAFEVVCCDCGDHLYWGYPEISLYWGYPEISLSLQRIRGPYNAMAAALVAYDQYLGLTTSPRQP
jgi:hypothetical protein